MQSFCLTGVDGETLAVKIERYLYPNEADLHDANWIGCRIQLKANDFTCSTSANLVTVEIAKLLVDVDAVLSGAAESFQFETTEELLAFQFSLTGPQEGLLTGVISGPHSMKCSCAFSFRICLAALQRFRSELCRAVEAYPIKG